jgi:hypothetical protein
MEPLKLHRIFLPARKPMRPATAAEPIAIATTTPVETPLDEASPEDAGAVVEVLAGADGIGPGPGSKESGLFVALGAGAR